ncbi:zinc-binding dehydrogenase [Pandoraea sp. NPDC087047]|uniref:zinc-dependent alcohol dehydrogenase n=1 Tax=Pandoraea sp. NPDC087047 TaxID=3364390 RepID=UPI00380AED14
MKAAVFHGPGDIEALSDVACPGVGEGEVLIQVEACGICGSDLHMYRTNAHRADLVRVSVCGREIPGHEFAGTVVAVGEGVEDFTSGDRVVGVGMGGMAEFVPIPVNPFQITHMPQTVSFEDAATTEPLADGLQMVRLAEIGPGENVVIFGVGMIGLGVIQVLRALDIDVGHIVAIDVSAQRLHTAKALGATHAINALTQKPVEQVGHICGVLPMYSAPFVAPNVSVVFDCAGYLKHVKGPPPLQSAMEMVGPRGGRIICFGAFEGEVTLDPMPIIHKQIVIRGSNGYAADELKQALDLMASGKIDRRMLISHQFPIAEIKRAFAVQASGQAIKVLIKPGL